MYFHALRVAIFRNQLVPTARSQLKTTLIIWHKHCVTTQLEAVAGHVRPGCGATRKIMRDSMKILLAVDGSDCSQTAVDLAARIPWPKGSALKIFSVAELPMPIVDGPMPMPGQYLAEWEKALEDQAVANTAKALSRYYDGGGSPIEVKAKATKGDPRDAILDEAAQWKANLIIIGTHGYNAFERILLGSVSRNVKSHAKCSVAIARQSPAANKQAGMKILLATDGSAGGEAAVAEIAERPWPAESEVHVISAIELPFTPTPETWALPDSYYSSLEKTGRELAEKAITSAVEQLRTSNAERETALTVTEAAIVGRAEDVIVETAKHWGADLIVLGSHGHRGWERFLLGSVSQAVAAHAHCSVQIVRGAQN